MYGFFHFRYITRPDIEIRVEFVIKQGVGRDRNVLYRHSFNQLQFMVKIIKSIFGNL